MISRMHFSSADYFIDFPHDVEVHFDEKCILIRRYDFSDLVFLKAEMYSDAATAAATNTEYFNIFIPVPQWLS